MQRQLSYKTAAFLEIGKTHYSERVLIRRSLAL